MEVEAVVAKSEVVVASVMVAVVAKRFPVEKAVDDAFWKKEVRLEPMFNGPAIVVEPVFDTAKSVEVAHRPVEEEMVKRFRGTLGVVVGEAKMERSPQGVVVPMPREPVEVKVEVPVAPKAALDEVCTRVKSEVPVALAKEKLPVSVALVANKFPAVSAVDDAYGNCEAARVDDEKKTPWVQILEVVAATEVVLMVVSQVKGAAPAEVWSAAQLKVPLFQVTKNPAWQVVRPVT